MQSGKLVIGILVAAALCLVLLPLAGAQQHRPGKPAAGDPQVKQKPSKGGTMVPAHRPGKRAVTDPKVPAGPAVKSLGVPAHRPGKAAAGAPYSRPMASSGMKDKGVMSAPDKVTPEHRPGGRAVTDPKRPAKAGGGGKAMVPAHRPGKAAAGAPKTTQAPSTEGSTPEHRPGGPSVNDPPKQ